MDCRQVLREELVHTYGVIPRFQAAEIIILTAISHGMKSDDTVGFIWITLNMPFPPPTIIPTGPLKLSSHPATGSDNVEITVN